VLAGSKVGQRNCTKWGGSEKGWHWRTTDDQIAAIREMKSAGLPVAQSARIAGRSRPTTYGVLNETTTT
jgi:hypothetical protein